VIRFLDREAPEPASWKDQRVIFEEAAGISPFKVRKIEALRNLENFRRDRDRLRDRGDQAADQWTILDVQLVALTDAQQTSPCPGTCPSGARQQQGMRFD